MIRYFTSHPTASNLIMLFFLVIGIISISKLQMETLPKQNLKYVQVKVTYPGASAKDVEDGICRKIEDAVDGVSNVQEITCESREGVGIAKVEIKEGQDWSDFIDDIKREVDKIDSFPEKIDTIVLSEVGKKENVIDLVVYADSPTLNLKEYANELKDELQSIDGISLIDIKGVESHEFRVSIPLIKLQKYSLSITDIKNALKSQNLNMPLGVIESKQNEYLLKFENESKNIKTLGDIIISNSSNAEVRLNQVAVIKERFKLDEEKIIFNGKRAIVLQVRKTRVEDTVQIADKIKEFIFTKEFPSSVKVELINDFSLLVVDRLRLLVENAVQGLLLVFLVLWLFFKIRFAFWVSMGLPVSFLGALWLMSLFGVSINMLSMVALLISIGILMDDAIVIAENVATEYIKTKEVLSSITNGVQKVANGVVSSFLTTCAIFVPISFLVGDIGQILRVVPIVLIMVLSVSLVEAFLILPNHLSHSLDNIEQKSKFKVAFEQKLEYVRENIVGRAVDKILEYRYLFLTSMIALFIFSIAMLAGGVLKFQAFPDIESDFVDSRILLPAGTPLEETQKVVDHIIKAGKQIDEEYKNTHGEKLIKNFAIYYNKNIDSFEKGKHIATISLELLTSDKRQIQMKDFISLWKEKSGEIPNALMVSFKEPGLIVGGLPIDIRLFSNDLDELKLASDELVTWIRSYDGIFYVNSDLRRGKKEYEITLKDGSLPLGINSTMVANELRSALYGFEVDEFQLFRENIEVNVRLKDNQNFLDILDLRLKGIPLSELINIKETKSFSRINRVDKKRVVTIQGEIDTRVTNANEIIADTKTKFLPQLLKKYPHINYGIKGQIEQSQKTGKSFASNFVIGLFMIFILLSVQFKSYLEAVIIMAIIPLAFIGVIWGHLLMGINLAMPSVMGLVSLGGVVINNSILLVLFLKSNIKELGLLEAAKKSSRSRFRAILLTSVTTIAGLLPLLLETSMQALILIPLAISIIFGLLATSILVLFLVPALYLIIDDVKRVLASR